MFPKPRPLFVDQRGIFDRIGVGGVDLETGRLDTSATSLIGYASHRL